MFCPQCEASIQNTDQESCTNSSCQVGIHIISGKVYKKPYLLNGVLKEAYGENRSLLADMDNSKTPGYIITREEIIDEILCISSLRKPKKITRRNIMLEDFGLIFDIFDENDKNEKSGYLCRISEDRPALPKLISFNNKKSIKNELSLFDEEAIEWTKNKIVKIFNNQSLLPMQKNVIRNIVGRSGSTTVCVLPTGSGKTRIAQAAVYSKKNKKNRVSERGPTLIISPTISLIDDQEKEWRKFNQLIKSNIGDSDQLKIKFLTTQKMKNEEINIFTILNQLLEGEIDVLCCSPERLLRYDKKISLMDIIPQLSAKKGLQFSNFIVDEAHIMFDWGDKIRPTFKLLPQLEKIIRYFNPDLRSLLMTATMTPDEVEIILDSFGCSSSDEKVEIIRDLEIRQDLAFTIIEESNLEDKIYEKGTKLLEQEYSVNRLLWRKTSYAYQEDLHTSPLLIYTFQKEHCKVISDKINFTSKAKETYHGNTNATKRRKVLSKFIRNEIKSLVATSAFGMGVNKGDIWLTGYIGSPPNLRELYQMFGRTARKSNWKRPESPKKNGNCIAVIPKNMNMQNKTFNPSMQTNKSMERVSQMFSQECIITSNGYIVINLDIDGSSYWNPSAREKNNNHISSKESTSQLERKQQMSDEAEIELRIQTLLLLQESGDIKIEGINYENPIIIENKGTGASLSELLEFGGYEAVLNEISKVGRNKVGLNRKRHRCIIIKIIKPIDGFNGFLQSIIKGLEIQKSSYEKGVLQLIKLVKSKGCIKKGFSPLIGIVETKTCLEEYINNQKNPLNNDKFASVPCSICRINSMNDDRIPKEIKDILFFDKEKPSIWLSEEEIELLSGRKTNLGNNENSSPIDIGECEIIDLSMENYFGGWAFNNNLNSYEIKKKLCETIIDNFNPSKKVIARNTQKYEIDIIYKDSENKAISGKKIKFTCLTQGDLILKIIEFDIEFPAKIKIPAGVLLFEHSNEILAREIPENLLIKYHHQWQKDLIACGKKFWYNKFMGDKPPWIDGSISW